MTRPRSFGRLPNPPAHFPVSQLRVKNSIVFQKGDHQPVTLQDCFYPAHGFQSDPPRRNEPATPRQQIVPFRPLFLGPSPFSANGRLPNWPQEPNFGHHYLKVRCDPRQPPHRADAASTSGRITYSSESPPAKTYFSLALNNFPPAERPAPTSNATVRPWPHQLKSTPIA